MGIIDYIAAWRSCTRQQTLAELANAELLRAAKDVCRVALYQTMAIKAMKIAVDKVEIENGKN